MSDLTTVRRLRKARRMTLEQLADNLRTSIGTANRLDRGEVPLLNKHAPKLAEIFEVSLADLLELNRLEGLVDDVAPYEGSSDSLLTDHKTTANVDVWEVGTRALDALGLLPGDRILVSNSAEAIANVSLGDAVVVALSDPIMKEKQTILLRQFIEPNLFITNSLHDNAPSLNRLENDILIQGLIRERVTNISKKV